MQSLGTAQLIELPHSTGATVKAWDLRPFGGEPLQLGLTTSPLPPAGSTTDRTLSSGAIIRIDTGTGEVWSVTKADPAPALGPPGGPPRRSVFGLSPQMLAVVAGIAWALFFRKKRR